jgi:hypothetical protein
MSGQVVKPSPEKVDPEILVSVIEEDLQDLGDSYTRQAPRLGFLWDHRRFFTRAMEVALVASRRLRQAGALIAAVAIP